MKNANFFHRSSFWIVALAILGLFLLALPNGSAQAAPVKNKVIFDHVKTGFPLTGAHVTLPCETCHIQGAFKGTPKKCATCHTQGSRILTSTFKPSNHMVTTQACEQCHTSTASWSVVFFSHAGVMPRQCIQCHNNNVAKGKPSNHMATNEPCDTCHRTTTWMSASFTHVNVTPGSCTQCHVQGGTASTFKPSGSSHIPTNLPCDACHTIGGSFGTLKFTHTAIQGVMPGQCETCHNGVYASLNVLGKAQASPTHIATTAACDTCHTGYATFAGANQHAGVIASAGTCSNSGCHIQGGAGLPKPTGSSHIPTSLTCNWCHNMTTFNPSTFTHASTQGVVAGQCETCHNGVYASLNVLGKAQASPTHIATTLSCDQCHSGYATFAGGKFNHTGVAAGTCASAGCHVQGGSGLTAPGNHIPYQSQLVAGSSMSCDACHTSTTTFTAERMNHNNSMGGGSGWCKGCHQSGMNYLGTMQKKSLNHYERYAGQTDCSSSGCHRPLGTQGTAYSRWTN